jgi:BTB/POZ domain.
VIFAYVLAILASQNDHFKALFSNGMKESTNDKLIIKDWNYLPFYHMISYFYSATIPMDLSFQTYCEILSKT